ncbi:MAG: hypothetical protein NTZ69_18840 [Bacteroidia bacterium]|nr:hypothetical protein [Bacteroidia bacterium]
MKRHYLLISLLLLVLQTSFGQNKSAALPSTYDRSSLTLILIDHSDSKLRDRFTTVEVPGKYFENKIEQKSIGVSFATGFDANSFANRLNQQKIGNQIISFCYSRQANGTMSADRFHERGLYNATDADVLKAKVTKLGMDVIKDYGGKIISKSYVAVLDYTGLREVNEGNSRGWYSDVKMYLFKIIFDDATQAILYNELWIYPDDSPEVKAKKKEAFDQMNFNLEFVSQASTPVSEQAFKIPPPNYPASLTQDQLLEVVLQTGLDKCLAKIEKNVEELKVKTTLYQTHPPRAKIGEKEGLKVDQCYFVYEYVYKRRTKSTKAVRRSVIRAKQVVDNRGVATGSSELSTFYQVASGRLKNGFTLQQHNEAGVGVYVGNEFGNVGGVSARIEKRGGGAVSIPAVYIFLEGGMQQKTYFRMYNNINEPLTNQNINFLRGDIGVAKGLHLIKILELAPYLSIGLEAAKNRDWNNDAQFNGNVLRSMYFKYGANLSLNLKYNIQAVGGIGGYLFLNAEDGKGEIVVGDQKVAYDYFFPDRAWGKAFSSYVGIRFQF